MVDVHEVCRDETCDGQQDPGGQKNDNLCFLLHDFFLSFKCAL